MSKGKPRPALGCRVPAAVVAAAVVAGGGGMMGQLQKLQEEMAKTQERLGDESVEVTVGGGAIKMAMNGHQKLLSVAILPDVLSPDDVEMLQDMILAAVNEAVERSQGLAVDKMSALTGGLKIPGLM